MVTVFGTLFCLSGFLGVVVGLVSLVYNTELGTRFVITDAIFVFFWDSNVSICETDSSLCQ